MPIVRLGNLYYKTGKSKRRGLTLPEQHLAGQSRNDALSIVDVRRPLPIAAQLQVVVQYDEGEQGLELVRNEEPSWAGWW